MPRLTQLLYSPTPLLLRPRAFQPPDFVKQPLHNLCGQIGCRIRRPSHRTRPRRGPQHIEADTMDNPPDRNAPASATDPERNFINGEIVRIEDSGSKLWVRPAPTNPPLPLDDGSPQLGGKGQD